MKTTKKNNYLLVDGEGLLYQSFHKFKNLKTSSGLYSGAVFGFFKSLRNYLYRFNPDDVYVVFDNGHSKYRTDVLKTYKAHRKKFDVDYKTLNKQKAVILKFLKILRIKYVFDKDKEFNYEGDDYIAYLVLKYLPKKSKIVIVTADKDFNQLLKGMQVKIYNPRKDTIIYEKTCMPLFGYKAKETVDYLSLVGDTSDDIPGYSSLGPIKTRKFLNTYGSIEKYLNQDQCLPDDKDHKKMRECWNTNRKLIDLKWFCNNYPLEKEKLPCVFIKKPINYKKFNLLVEKYQLNSFKDKLFTKVFDNQYKTTYYED